LGRCGEQPIAGNLRDTYFAHKTRMAWLCLCVDAHLPENQLSTCNLVIKPNIGIITNMPRKSSSVSSRTSPTKAGAAAKPVAAIQPLSFPEALARAPVPVGRREQILHAAVDVLNADGFGALTQTRVAERAGIRQSHLTYYFPARNDLLRETAVYGCEALLGALESGIETGELNVENFREVLAVDVHDRRFARLMCALIVASDEDAGIKPWLATFEAANVEKMKSSFHKLGLPVTLDEVAFFHATYVGSVMLDLGESTDDSLERAQRKVTFAFDTIANAARARNRNGATSKAAQGKKRHTPQKERKNEAKT
jgi:AcrR family transcriptional regulator